MNFTGMRFIFSRCRFLLSGICAVILAFSLASVGLAQDETDEAVKIFNQAQESHEKGDLQSALKFYDEAIKLLPEFPEAEYQRGNVLLSLGKSDEAEKAFRRALELREDWTLPMTNLGALLVQKNNFPEAEKLLMKAIRENELNFAAYSALTELRLKTKASPETLKELLTKIQFLTAKANPTASIWTSRAALENALGDKASAKASLKRALAINPNDKSALLEQAEIALAESDKPTALEAAKVLEKIAPKSSEAKILQARIFASDGNVRGAVKILDSIENSTPEVALWRDNILASTSINTAELEKQLEKDAKNVVILGRLCAVLRTENPTKALDFCRRASEAEPNNINHAVGFSAALVQAKQYENAVIVLKRILQIAPDNFTAHANLATALFQSKRFSESKTEYLWLTEKQPNLAIAYYFLAIAHDSLGEYLDAGANYQQFLKIADPVRNKLEIEKVNLRLPSLEKLIKEKKGKK
ncbi:MAG TPA: tetratricopeptide repeat protein [Pyrinomonadaceae bacterium]|nr:tetratricopeptide repeat protein [Pyrinomonadaceae bacterium]